MTDEDLVRRIKSATGFLMEYKRTGKKSDWILGYNMTLDLFDDFCERLENAIQRPS